MTIAHAHLVDPLVCRWYHGTTRCVRRAFLLCEGANDRKTWVENRLRELAEIFAIGVGGYSVLDNHLHLLIRLDPDVAAGWSDEQVVRRWGRVFPPRDGLRQPIPVSDQWVQSRLADTTWVKMVRGRLQSLRWFMKCLKEPLSRLANRRPYLGVDAVINVYFLGLSAMSSGVSMGLMKAGGRISASMRSLTCISSGSTQFACPRALSAAVAVLESLIIL